MYTVNFIFKGGAEWDKNSPSIVYPGRLKSGLEHLILEGAMSFDTAIEMLSYLRSLPITISEDVDPKYPGASVVFHFDIESDEELKNNIVEFLESNRSDISENFEMSIDVITKYENN